ncbi:MAG: helix-turn-helix domain-containing protein [Thiomicrorhabdus sp.]|nr:helix-turn-helix domain-containing protein [Thiomicrorhabdus sp.]
MQTLAILLIGFSVFYATVFVFIHFKKSYSDKQKTSLFFGVILLVSLVGLQLIHFYYLLYDSSFIKNKPYLFLLYLVAPSFYLYSRAFLKAQNDFSWTHLLHFSPLISIFIFSHNTAFVMAFVIGSAYLLWLLTSLYALKKYREAFKIEILLLSFVFVVAIAVSIIALIMPFNEKLFYALYASAIGFALFVVALLLNYKPNVSESVTEIAQQTYAVSTLNAIDCAQKLKQLDALMKVDKLYQQSNLNLHTIASELELSTHQLSELINTKLKMSFSSYLRQQRIDAAKKILLSQPDMSVVSVSLEAGFSSQSNFYAAFKEFVGTTPAKYRKQIK